MKATLSAIEYYLPSNVLSNDDLVKDFDDWNPEKIEKKVGIKCQLF